MSTTIIPLVSSRASTGVIVPSPVRREIVRTTGNALVAQIREQLRGHLANEALEITAALSALESQLIAIGPLGEARYKAIVDSFALSSASAIRRL